MGGTGGKWVRGQCLGRGSTAAVYLAASSSRDKREEYFAVKSAELSHSTPLRREQKILSSLSSPHVVSCLGSDVTSEPDGRVLYNLFIEYVPGGSLADAIKQRGGLDERVVRLCTQGILDGLAFLHGKGIVHCDVKGQNVLVGADDGTVKLADFGCARWVDDGSKVISGTPLYMAPEVARGEEQGPAADIWALGCTVIEMATGCPPWRDVADPVAAVHRIAFSAEVPELPCNISDDGRDFLGRCLNRDPRQRWSAEELLNHPFVERINEFTTGRTSDSKGTSPKSTLDQEFWDSWREEEDDDEDHEEEAKLEPLPLGSALARLRLLVGGADHVPPPSPTRDEHGCWITVRIGVPSRDLQPSTGGWSSSDSEEAVSAAAAGEEDLARYGDGRPYPSTVEAASLPCTPFLNCYQLNDVTDHSCVTSELLREGDALVNHHKFFALFSSKWERSVGCYAYDDISECCNRTPPAEQASKLR